MTQHNGMIVVIYSTLQIRKLHNMNRLNEHSRFQGTTKTLWPKLIERYSTYNLLLLVLVICLFFVASCNKDDLTNSGLVPASSTDVDVPKDPLTIEVAQSILKEHYGHIQEAPPSHSHSRDGEEVASEGFNYLVLEWDGASEYYDSIRQQEVVEVVILESSFSYLDHGDENGPFDVSEHLHNYRLLFVRDSTDDLYVGIMKIEPTTTYQAAFEGVDNSYAWIDSEFEGIIQYVDLNDENETTLIVEDGIYYSAETSSDIESEYQGGSQSRNTVECFLYWVCIPCTCENHNCSETCTCPAGVARLEPRLFCKTILVRHFDYPSGGTLPPGFLEGRYLSTDGNTNSNNNEGCEHSKLSDFLYDWLEFRGYDEADWDKYFDCVDCLPSTSNPYKAATMTLDMDCIKQAEQYEICHELAQNFILVHELDISPSDLAVILDRLEGLCENQSDDMILKGIISHYFAWDIGDPRLNTINLERGLDLINLLDPESFDLPDMINMSTDLLTCISTQSQTYSAFIACVESEIANFIQELDEQPSDPVISSSNPICHEMFDFELYYRNGPDADHIWMNLNGLQVAVEHNGETRYFRMGNTVFETSREACPSGSDARFAVANSINKLDENVESRQQADPSEELWRSVYASIVTEFHSQMIQCLPDQTNNLHALAHWPSFSLIEDSQGNPVPFIPFVSAFESHCN